MSMMLLSATPVDDRTDGFERCKLLVQLAWRGPTPEEEHQSIALGLGPWCLDGGVKAQEAGSSFHRLYEDFRASIVGAIRKVGECDRIKPQEVKRSLFRNYVGRLRAELGESKGCTSSPMRRHSRLDLLQFVAPSLSRSPDA